MCRCIVQLHVDLAQRRGNKDFIALSKAASAAYKQLPLAEKEALKLRLTEQTVMHVILP